MTGQAEFARPSRYRDRYEAGRWLARELGAYAGHEDALVLALPRGGVPVGYEIARELDLPLDVLNVRKLGYPGEPELALGAIASGGVRVLNDELLAQLGISEDVVRRVEREEATELERRERLYRGDRPWPELKGRTVIVVDDGVATGSTILAAVRAVRAQRPARIVAAVPVAGPQACEGLAREADEVICPLTPAPFFAISPWYDEFPQLTDRDVIRLLEDAAEGRRAPAPAPRARVTSRTPSGVPAP